MPELPEVETTRRGIAPHVEGRRIEAIVVRQPHLRWPVPDAVQCAVGQYIRLVRRRAKYLLLETDLGSIVLHLGMSGSLIVKPVGTAVLKHDHVDIVFENGQCLRLNDPRRFGAFLWQNKSEVPLGLFQGLGPEPLSDSFDGKYLFERSRGRSVAVKNFIMTNAVVVGVGNIYANEALFMAGIDPRRAAGRISCKRYVALGRHIKTVLSVAIEKGGRSSRFFTAD